MNAGAGRNLNWFWKKWFFDNGVPDLAIGKVDLTDKPTVEIIAKGTKPVPVNLLISFADSTTQTIHRNIGVWEKGNTNIILPLPAGKQVVKLTLAGSHVPDVEKDNNKWINK
jgi:hypothetical protein